MDLYLENPQFQLAFQICQKLQSQGHQALLAGGCVRDFLLQREPNDFDVATSALPDEVEKLFPKTVAVGKSFGVIVVIENNQQVEVATFRKDGPYQDGRRPVSVEFSKAEEDAKRRDFTINGLFYDLSSKETLDYVGGLRDLPQKLIRAIGSPSERFHEDHLRLFRALRFAAQLNFEIEGETWKAICQDHALISSVSGERIQDEMGKMLASGFLEKGLDLLFRSGLLTSLTGVSQWSWKSPHSLFTGTAPDLEDRWLRFFFWLQQMSPQEMTLKRIESFCDQWKFSRELKQKTLHSLQWVFETTPFLKKPLGEILSLSYEPDHGRGIQLYSQFLMESQEQPIWQQLQNRKAQLGPVKPQAWIGSADLLGKFQGEALGKALKQSYYEQLEGKISTREELRKKWGL